ncbi:zinc finger protein 766-like [Pleurodeles waltl]|uniref:zinc finger protein 766-like n=1 Tax=Pleurodeles waltl TaxID=8319 RepID=UPI0037095684
MPMERLPRASALLHDLSARLSEEDWALLHEWQTELYEVVMKELHQALASLGPVIASSIFALRPKEKQDVFCAGRQDCESQSSCVPSPDGTTTSDDGHTDQQLGQGQHTTEQEDQQSPSTGEQPLPTEVEDMTEPPSECIQLRHPSSLLQLRIEDGILAKLLIVQPGEESRNRKRKRKRKAGVSAVCAEEKTACRVTPKKGRAAVLRSAQKEAESIQCASGARPRGHSRDYKRTPNTQKSKVRDTNRRCRPSAQNSVGAHACAVCQKTFPRAYHLRRHQKVLSGESPYQCTECEQSFTHQRYLTAHQASHGGTKRFNCAQCSKLFSSQKNLSQHHIWQHGKKTSSRRHRPYLRAKL